MPLAPGRSARPWPTRPDADLEHGGAHAMVMEEITAGREHRPVRRRHELVRGERLLVRRFRPVTDVRIVPGPARRGGRGAVHRARQEVRPGQLRDPAGQVRRQPDPGDPGLLLQEAPLHHAGHADAGGRVPRLPGERQRAADARARPRAARGVVPRRRLPVAAAPARSAGAAGPARPLLWDPAGAVGRRPDGQTSPAPHAHTLRAG